MASRRPTRIGMGRAKSVEDHRHTPSKHFAMRRYAYWCDDATAVRTARADAALYEDRRRAGTGWWTGFKGSRQRGASQRLLPEGHGLDVAADDRLELEPRKLSRRVLHPLALKLPHKRPEVVA